MPSNPDVLAQKYYDGVIKVGVRGTLNPQLSVRQRKEDADAEAAVTRKLNEESVKAGASGASASAEADNQAGHLAEEPLRLNQHQQRCLCPVLSESGRSRICSRRQALAYEDGGEGKN